MKDDSLNLTLETKSKGPLLRVVAVCGLLPKQVVQLRKAIEWFVSKSAPSMFLLDPTSSLLGTAIAECQETVFQMRLIAVQDNPFSRIRESKKL